MLFVFDDEFIFFLLGNGDLIEFDDGIIVIGLGGVYVLVAVKVLVRHSDLEVSVIVENLLVIVASICVYSNFYIMVEFL